MMSSLDVAAVGLVSSWNRRPQGGPGHTQTMPLGTSMGVRRGLVFRQPLPPSTKHHSSFFGGGWSCVCGVFVCLFV